MSSKTQVMSVQIERQQNSMIFETKLARSKMISTVQSCLYLKVLTIKITLTEKNKSQICNVLFEIHS